MMFYVLRYLMLLLTVNIKRQYKCCLLTYVVIINQIVALNIWFEGHVPIMNNLFDSEWNVHITSYNDNIKHPFCSGKFISQAHTFEFYAHNYKF